MRKCRPAIPRALLAAVLSASATLALLEIGLRQMPASWCDSRVDQALAGLEKQTDCERNPFDPQRTEDT